MSRLANANDPAESLPDPLDRSRTPLDPARPGDEEQPPVPFEEDPELDADKVRRETDDGEMSPDDPA